MFFKKQRSVPEAGQSQGTDEFEFEGKKYRVLKGARVPLANGAEQLTAADICVHPEAQEYLVTNGCGCIEEVIE